MFWSMSLLAPDANMRMLRVSPAVSGELVDQLVRRSPSSARSGPFAVPSMAQKAGALALIAAMVFQVLAGVC